MTNAKTALAGAKVNATDDDLTLSNGTQAFAQTFPAYNQIVVYKVFWISTNPPGLRVQEILHEVYHLLNPGFEDGNLPGNDSNNPATQYADHVIQLIINTQEYQKNIIKRSVQL